MTTISSVSQMKLPNVAYEVVSLYVLIAVKPLARNSHSSSRILDPMCNPEVFRRAAAVDKLAAYHVIWA